MHVPSATVLSVAQLSSGFIRGCGTSIAETFPEDDEISACQLSAAASPALPLLCSQKLVLISSPGLMGMSGPATTKHPCCSQGFVAFASPS